MSTRKYNNKVRKLFSNLVGKQNKWNIFYYDDKRKNGGGRKIFKSYGSVEYIKIWKEIVENYKNDGWELYESSSWRGDGCVVGMKKDY